MQSSTCQYPSHFSLSALWVLLPDSNRNMLGIAVMLLNGLKFIKEFNFLRTLIHTIRVIWSCLYVWMPNAKILYMAFPAKIGGN